MMPSLSQSSIVSTSLTQDWKYPRTAKGFTGSDQKSVSCTVLRCVTNTRIPCTAQEFSSMGKTRFTLTVLGVGSVGWAYAPYKKPAGNKKVPKDPNAKQLFEIVRNEDRVTGVRMFSFKKAKSNFDRDEHDPSINAEINIGQVMTFFVQSFMFDSKKSDNGMDQYIFPRDMQFIPEFTVVDMHLMTSHNDTEGGYGCKLKKIALHQTSLYSYLGVDSLHLLPGTYDKATDLAVERARNNLFIHNQFESKNVAFFGKVPANSFISSVPVVDGFYRIVGPNGAELFPGVPCVDIAQEDLFRFSNSVADDIQDRVLDAITLLDFASCASALHLYVVGLQAYKTGDPMLSDFRGVPLVDVDAFLRSVDFEDVGGDLEVGGVVMEDRVIFPFKHEIVSIGAKPIVTVFTTPVEFVGKPAPCPDFSLLSEESSVGKGYLVTIGTRAMPDILRVVFNVKGCMTMPGGSPVRMDYLLMRTQKKRKSMSSGDDAEDGEVESPA